MSKLAFTAACTLATAMFASSAQADVLTFDDLSGTHYFSSVYHGFSFGNLNAQTNVWFWSNDVSTPFIPASPFTSLSTDSTAYSNKPFEDSMPISSATPFVFNGAYFSGVGDNADGSAAKVAYKLYSGTSLVLDTTLTPSSTLSSVPTYYASGYSGLVTSVVVSGPQGYFAMDNFTYSVAAVPEASSLQMLALGIIAVGFAARRARRRA